MRWIIWPLMTASTAAVPIPATDAAVLRATLAEIATRNDYCIPAALDEAPFAGIRRDMAEYASDQRAIAEAEGKPAPPPPSDADVSRNIADHVGSGWLGLDDKPVAEAVLAPIRAAAVALAMRGDPAPLPGEPVVELNASASADDVIATSADVPGPPDHGTLSPAWLAKGQRLQPVGDHCTSPTASLSAVAREGDVAFVDVGFVWGPLAGVGETWALRRGEHGRWQVVARRHTWVS